MKCDNHLCIYEENGFCFNRNVSISDKGTCKICTYPKIEEKFLTAIKMQAIIELTKKGTKGISNKKLLHK